jgi:phosphoserine phosphatase RsbU/P
MNSLNIQTWLYPTITTTLLITFLITKKYIATKNNRTSSKKQNASDTIKKNYLKELQMARRVQEGLLSVENPQLDSIHIAKRCVPAENIGGDFYTFINKDAHSLQPQTQKIPGVIKYVDTRETYFGVIIGDVAGHGVSSALVMALSSGLLGEISKSNNSPAFTFKEANNDIIKYIENSQISHVTAFYALINTYSKKMTYAKAGHSPALLMHKDNTCTELDADGIFLGIFPDETYQESEVQLESGDRLFLYTDGIIEAKNEHSEEFGLDRFIQIIRENSKLDIDTLLNLLFTKAKKFIGNQDFKDDQTLVILEIG